MPFNLQASLAQLNANVQYIQTQVNTINRTTFNSSTRTQTINNTVNRIADFDDRQILSELNTLERGVQSIIRDIMELRIHNDECHATTQSRLDSVSNLIRERSNFIVEDVRLRLGSRIIEARDALSSLLTDTQNLINRRSNVIIRTLTSRVDNRASYVIRLLTSRFSTAINRSEGVLSGLIEASTGELTALIVGIEES